MQGMFRSIAVAALLAIAALSSGCATVVKGSKQNIAVQTDPEGASCELAREGQIIGVVSPTPGNIEVEKDKDPIDVTCKKKGFKDATEFMASSFQGWTLGNVLIGGLVGLAIDAGSGAATQYAPGVSLKLAPESFATTEERTDFFDKWRSDIMQNSTKAKIAAAKICSGTQCDEIVKRIDRETEQALAGIDAQRNLGKSESSSGAAQPREAAPAPSGPVTAAAAPTQASQDGSWRPRNGERWKYRMLHGKRMVGTLVIEASQGSDGRVMERITKEGSPGFVAERDVRPEFVPTAFLPAVQLPGGYSLFELSAYFPPGAALDPGKSLGGLSGQLLIPQGGMRSLVWDTRVIGLEKVRVPAGEFDAWKIEAHSKEVTVEGPLSIVYHVWYSPTSQRAVKISLDFDHRIEIAKSQEILELAAHEEVR
jgi:hypothetical protein